MSALKRLCCAWFTATLLLSATSALAVPNIQQWRTANDIPVYFIAAPELPMVDVQILFNAGSAYAAQQPGLAQFTNALLEEGAGDWSADEIAQRFDQVGARFNSEARRDAAVVTLRSLSDPRYLQPAAQTVALLLQQPKFAADAVERVRQQMLTALQERAQAPAALAQDAFFAALYGNHPYALPVLGNAESLRRISREMLQDFHRRHYVAANALLVMVGDLQRPAAEALANTLVGNLPKGEAVAPLPPVAELSASQTIRIPHPSAQTHILIGQLGIQRTDPDYYALDLGNHVFGGNGLVSQLALEIREQRALAYAASSAFIPMHASGAFIISLQTRNEQAQTALEVAETTLRQFTTNGAPTQQLEEARQNISAGFALGLAGNGKLVNQLGMMAFYGLPLDYLDTFTSRINAISAQQVQSAWQRHVQPQRLLKVIVGGAAAPGA